MNPEQKLDEISQRFKIPPKVVKDVLYDETQLVQADIVQKVRASFAENGEASFVCLVSRGIDKRASSMITVDSFTRPIVTTARQSALDKGYTLVFYTGNIYLNDEAYYERLLLKKPHSGLLVVIPHHLEMIKKLCEKHQQPCVFIDAKNTDNNPLFPSISVSNKKSVETIMRYLTDLGHRRIATITGVMSMTSAIDRFEGYKQGLMNAGLPLDENLVYLGDWSTELAQKLAHGLLSQANPPTAIVAANDLTAIGVINTAQSMGLAVPDDLSIVGFDNIETAEILKLTTLNQPLLQIGKLALENLVDCLEGRIPANLNNELEAEIIIRATTAAPRAID
jgi:DNA-binding LacI/PurR family transcriptional regulator